MICIDDHSRRFETELYAVCRYSPYGAAILSYYNSYCGGTYAFLDFWIQRDNGDKAVCAFCRYYSTMIICGENYEPAETEEFIGIIAPAVIICEDIFKIPNDYKKTLGEIMICKKIAPNCRFLHNLDVVKIESNMRDLRKVYNLLVLSSGEKECMPDFESYFLDISQKLRHKNAEVYAVKDSFDNIVSTASLISITSETVLIGDTATSTDYRNNGYASTLVRHITQKQLSLGKSVYLYRDKKTAFYGKIGFESYGNHSQYRRKSKENKTIEEINY